MLELLSLADIENVCGGSRNFTLPDYAVPLYKTCVGYYGETHGFRILRKNFDSQKAYEDALEAFRSQVNDGLWRGEQAQVLQYRLSEGNNGASSDFAFVVRGRHADCFKRSIESNGNPEHYLYDYTDEEWATILRYETPIFPY